MFILASGPGWLYPARILSGVSAGLMTGAATAALTETVSESSSRRASLVATAATAGGAALGPLMAGLFAQYLPQPTVLVFEVYLGLLATAALALVFIPETVTMRGRPSLRFTGLAIPAEGRGEFIAAGVAAFAAYVLAGLGLLPPGLALVAAGMSAASLVLFGIGAVVAGSAFGALVIGSLSAANRLASAETRAQVISTYFVFAYSGLSIPVVGVGVASDYVGTFRAVLGCSILLTVLCVLSAAGISGGRRATQPPRGA